MIKQIWFPWWSICGLILLSVFTIGIRLSLVNTTYSINEIERENNQLMRERENQSLKHLQLRSPRKLEALAKNKFQLKTPESRQWIHLK